MPAAGWAELFPFVVKPSVTLTASPASPQFAGTSVTLKAKVPAADPGTVQFYSGTTALGASVAVKSGAASHKFAPKAGKYSFTAVFLPTLGDLKGADTATASIVAEATSAAVKYTVNAEPTLTKVTPATVTAGKAPKVTLTGTGFIKGITVTVSSTSITVAVNSVSATTVKTVFTVPSATPAGTYSVQVTNTNGGTATCPNCLTVKG